MPAAGTLHATGAHRGPASPACRRTTHSCCSPLLQPGLACWLDVSALYVQLQAALRKPQLPAQIKLQRVPRHVVALTHRQALVQVALGAAALGLAGLHLDP